MCVGKSIFKTIPVGALPYWVERGAQQRIRLGDPGPGTRLFSAGLGPGTLARTGSQGPEPGLFSAVEGGDVAQSAVPPIFMKKSEIIDGNSLPYNTSPQMKYRSFLPLKKK